MERSTELTQKELETIMNEITIDYPCVNCRSNTRDTCDIKTCSKWRAWFGTTWKTIREQLSNEK